MEKVITFSGLYTHDGQLVMGPYSLIALGPRQCFNTSHLSQEAFPQTKTISKTLNHKKRNHQRLKRTNAKLNGVTRTRLRFLATRLSASLVWEAIIKGSDFSSDIVYLYHRQTSLRTFLVKKVSVANSRAKQETKQTVINYVSYPFPRKWGLVNPDKEECTVTYEHMYYYV
jgi:hypothetical protein